MILFFMWVIQVLPPDVRSNTRGTCHSHMIIGGDFKMKKRIISLLLAAAMLLTLLPQLPIEANAHEIVMTAD